MTKKFIPRSIGFLAIFLVLLAISSCARQSRPNVVVIVIDTLRADRLPFYGYPKDTMPFLNGLAPKSVVFEKAYAGSSWTAPATASIFTGLYPFQHGVIMGLQAQKKMIKNNPVIKINRIPDEVQTLPEIFKANGYRTFGISDNANISNRQGFEQGFDNLLSFSHRGGKAINQKLLELEKEIKSSSRYFLYIHYNDPHRPYKLSLGKEERSGERIKDFKLLYDKELTLVDQCIGELYHRFGWGRNTLIVVTADHGEEMMERGFYGHGRALFNTAIHVPLIFYYPDGKRVSAGVVPDAVSTLDILPTLAGLLGFATIPHLAGQDLSPQLRNPEAAGEARHLYSHLHLKKADSEDIIHIAAIFKDFKYLSQSNGWADLFYNLKTDPQETKNIYAGSQQQAKELAASYFKFERDCRRFNPDYVDIKLDKKSIEQLRSLGYIR